MHIPHIFPSLLDFGASPSVLLIGAGMSFGIAPPVTELTNEIRQNHDDIIQNLGVDPSPLPDSWDKNNEIYDWADRAFSKLRSELNLTDHEAKLRLADAMRITTDPRFHAKVGMPLRGNTPRHRVVARLAREGRWNSIWSLNWDCILETALESVGLQNQPDPKNPLANPLPWKRWYCTWSPKDSHSPVPRDCTIHVIKPHGCVNKLANGNSLFIITRSEMGQLTDDLQLVAGRMNIGFSDAQLVTIGWSADEEYIHSIIRDIKKQGTLIHQGLDKLSVVNRTWYPKNQTADPEKHDKLAKNYDVDRNSCFFSTGNAGEPTIDDLFKWLQTLYGLGRMRKYACAQFDEWSNQVTQLDQIIADFPEPILNHWLNYLFDDFLSVWVRLCFNASLVIYKNNSAPVPQNLVATHRRDEHIPWGFGYTDRFDLLAVIPLVLAIWQSSDSKDLKWDFSEFPGAMWNSHEGHLVLPLPAWNTEGQPIELAALKPLMEGWNWSHKGAIKQLSILPLLHQPSFSAVTDDNLALRSSVAWLMKANKFANPDNIGVVSLSDI